MIELEAKSLSNVARLAVPLLLLLAMVLAAAVRVPLPEIGPYAGDIRPDFALMAVYYWSIYRPTLVPPFLCFAAGLLTDFLTGMPLGLNALIFVALQWIVRDQRRFLMAQPYVVLWAIFGFVAILSGLMLWTFYGLAHLNWPPLLPIAATICLSVVLFPPVTMLLIFIHRLLPVASRAYP